MIFFYIDLLHRDEQLDSDINRDSDHSENNLNSEYKMSLIKQDTDSDFYKYMKENNKNLLDFGISDDDDDNDDDDDDDDDVDSSVDLDDAYISEENLEVCFY